MAAPLTCTRLAICTVVAVLLQILGFSLFLVGFFPVKPTLPGFSGLESYRMPSCNPTSEAEKEVDLPPEKLRSLYTEASKIPPLYDRLILMVIDGLPAEFVLGRGGQHPTKTLINAMPYTQSLLASGKAIAYHAKAAPPTVTMPRLKAMVSGAIGGFLDVAFNFNTQAFLDDNLLDQFYRIGWKLLLLGDETWIKMFPNLFSRQDGVSSFYVKDTIEVDHNVSRHLEIELVAKDWNLLILHYLGLDHVGHIGGRQSVLMAPKLKEMDDVIQMIHLRCILPKENADSRTLLVVVSDHGMTDGGNHGGSSYEETDSLALFIGHGVDTSTYSLNDNNEAFQVDIAPTLSLLLGVPIPRNNIGMLLTKLFDLMTDDQRLRALELNSWQLLRLLQAHLPGLYCGDSSCVGYERDLQISIPVDNTKENFCHLFSKAVSAHNSWRFHQNSDLGYVDIDYFGIAAQSYYDFLRYASEWLSHRATDKPIHILLSAIVLMLLSFALLTCLVLCLFGKPNFMLMKRFSRLKEPTETCNLDGVFALVAVILQAVSLASSSMVEEEQYTWHFLTSTMYLIFLFMSVQCLVTKANVGVAQRREAFRASKFRFLKENLQDTSRFSSVIIVLICGRILRGWHQGGVNWVHLPDVSKLLVHANSSRIKALQIISLLAIMNLYSLTVTLWSCRTNLVLGVWSSHLISGLIVALHIMKSQIDNSTPIDYSATSIAQMFYISASTAVLLTLIASPWLFPVSGEQMQLVPEIGLHSHFSVQSNSLLVGFSDSMYLNGTTYAAFWCILQLLLQQPINAVPVLLIYVQMIFSIIHFSTKKSLNQWVEVTAIHFLGLAGHFGLGNTNTLATIDVAGAFIGISSHSTLLSGILMFIITYASPLLSYLSMVMYIALKNIITNTVSPQKSGWGGELLKTIAIPCLLPLLINSVVLTSFTIILMLMRNHLFVWSVFSPKYLYVCAGTVCVYIGVFIIAVTGAYTSSVLAFRARNLQIKES